MSAFGRLLLNEKTPDERKSEDVHKNIVKETRKMNVLKLRYLRDWLKILRCGWYARWKSDRT
eukprot:GSA25T00005791001.1